jgi:hypothetical protein
MLLQIFNTIHFSKKKEILFRKQLCPGTQLKILTSRPQEHFQGQRGHAIFSEMLVVTEPPRKRPLRRRGIDYIGCMGCRPPVSGLKNFIFIGNNPGTFDGAMDKSYPLYSWISVPTL